MIEWPPMDMLLFLLLAGFAASFIDSVVGGGGLISVPALLLTGLPTPVVLGTNKLGSTLSSLTSTASFLFSGKISGKLVAALFPLSFAGSVLGSYTVHRLPSDFLRPLVVVLLIIMLIYTLVSKKGSRPAAVPERRSQAGRIALAAGAAVLGFYDGFFGPGTGSFLIFMFLLSGFDYISASANAKVLNFASNLAGLASFLYLGSVHIGYGLTMGAAMIAGAMIGSQVAIRQGSRYVKPLFIGMTALLIGKQVWDLLQ